ncbi:MAG: hypothetical protein P0119_07000 [Nitrospira sp.]|nr:hypothetical protein [Nitrospira sp.]
MKNGSASIKSVTRLFLTAFVMTSCGSGNSENSPTSSGNPPTPIGTTVQVSVEATDPDRDQLHYRWAATEGTINNVDAPNTTWVVPRGSGLQFAYVLVSDDKGGYTESRAAALTFADVASETPFNFTPPTNIPPTTGFAWGTLYYHRTATSRNVYLPGVSISVAGNSTSVTATTDLKGEFFIPNLPFGSYSATYSLPGGIQGTFPFSVTRNSLPTSPSAESYVRVVVPGGALRIAGHVSLADGSLCGIRNEFFTNSTQPNSLTGPRSATVELLNTSNQSLSEVVPVNHYGDFFITRSQGQFEGFPNARLLVRCEQAPDKIVNLTVPVSGDIITLPIIIDASSDPATPNNRPIISKMTVALGGADKSRPDLPKPTTLLPEMDLAPGDDVFLTYKGIDTRKGACAYYHKIGAVQGCDEDGFPTSEQLTLDQWKKTVNLSPFHNGNPAEPEFKAIYVNKQDLNLTRDMQGIKLQDGTLAYNVCNYPGPQNVNDPLGAPTRIGDETQPDINLAIDNARRGIGKVVCVAMDYSEARGVRFYTFGPSGKLLLSVSLDGRREKFMPGTCVACHGGDNYGGKFPDDYSPTNPTGSGHANLGSYFLPFDVANFYFSTSDSSLSRKALLSPLRRMNELLASVPDNAATKPIVADLKSLITTRWYPSTNTNNEQTNPAPSVYSTQPTSLNGVTCASCHSSGTPGTSVPGPYQAEEKHAAAIAPSCQVCHTSNYQVADPIGTGSPRISFLERPPAHYLRGSNSAPRGPHSVCGGSSDLKMNHAMPNALSAFERFWLKKGTDQPTALFSIPSPGTGQQLGFCSTPSRHPEL